MDRTRFIFYSIAIVLLALLVREWFVLVAWTPDPTRGDASAYLRYAMNLKFSGTFSQAFTGQPITPDAFRTPGYPFLLALLKLPRGEDWFQAIFHAQALMGAATVACVIALAREWLPRGWALLAGGWLALQPHHIAATGAILTEVTLGLVIAGGLLCAAVALRRRSLRLAVLAGAIWGFGYLVNPVVALVPFLLVPLFWRAGLPRQGAALALVALVAIGGWSIRNAAQGAKGSDRAAVNLVQGSWPEYHDAWRYPFMFPMQNAAMAVELDAAVASTNVGLRTILIRMGRDPGRYLHWYLVQKPWLLWDWDVRIGHGTVYAMMSNNSPLDRGLLLGLTTIQWVLNPLVFMLAFIGILTARGPALLVAGFVVYVTIVHMVFQAEPRYAIPYRGMEILLAVSALRWIYAKIPKGQAESGYAEAGTVNELV